jgi:hypothetical protein
MRRTEIACICFAGQVLSGVTLQLRLMDTTLEDQASQENTNYFLTSEFFSLCVLAISEIESLYSESRDTNFYNMNEDCVPWLAIGDTFNQYFVRVVRAQHQEALPNVKPLIFPVFCPS